VTTIVLHKYHEQINALLDAGEYDLARQHCRYILQQHPQHVASYRLLAKALLEQGDHNGAAELFQRILSADPNDHIAHAGLAIIYQEEDVISQSLWHLERAHEIEPYNAAIQQELRALRIKQSARKNKKDQNGAAAATTNTLMLPEGALARLYMRGELYDLAIAQLRAALAADEDRIDLRVLLVEALWREGRRMESVNVCLQVLEQLPNCIAANAILAEIWLRTGRTEEAQSYLHRVHALTLLDEQHLAVESPAGRVFQVEGAFPLPAVVEVEYLGADEALIDFVEPQDQKLEASATAVGAAVTAVAEQEDNMYQWLEGLTGELPADANLVKPDTTDWWPEEEAEIDEATAVAPPSAPSDWLADLAVNANDEFRAESDYLEEADLLTDADLLTASLFDNRGTDNETAVASSTTLPDAAHDVPDWLSDITNESLEPWQVDPRTAADWMKNDAPVQPHEAEEDDYDWLNLDSPLEPDDHPVIEIEDAGELDLSAFDNLGLDQGQSETAEVEWRLTDELNKTETRLPASAPSLASSTPVEPEDEVPDWLASSASDTTEELVDEQTNLANEVRKELAEWVAANVQELDSDDESLAWLSTSDSIDAPAETPPTIVAATLASATAAPDEPGEAEEELPNWLRGDSVQYKSDSGLLDSGLLNTSAFGEDAATDAGEMNLDFISDGLPDWLDEDPDWEEIDSGGSDKLPDWLMGDSLDIPDSAPLTPAPLETDFLFEQADETAVSPAKTPEQPPVHGSEMLRTAAIMDYSFDDAVMEGADLPDWLSTGLEQEQPAEINTTAGMDLEVAVSDEKDAQLNGPTQEPTDLPPPSGDLDWLDELDTFPATAPTMLDALIDTGELPDWMQIAEAETPVPAQPPDDDTAVAPEFPPEEDALPPLEGELDLEWLDALAAEPQADPADEMPTWQWPDSQPDPAQLTAVELDTLMAMEVTAAETAVSDPPQDKADAVPYDDLDDAMAWLEELAAEPDAPIEELSTIAQEIDLADVTPPQTVTDWLAAIEEEEFSAIELEEIAVETTVVEATVVEATKQTRLKQTRLKQTRLKQTRPK
jgi:tetratricopeptide (TPR) repeat protein